MMSAVVSFASWLLLKLHFGIFESEPIKYSLFNFPKILLKTLKFFAETDGDLYGSKSIFRDKLVGIIFNFYFPY